MKIADQEESRIWTAVREAVPGEPPNIIEWGEANVQLPTSALSKHFTIQATPWIREPLLRATDLETRMVTLMKPVQTGGSAFGELLLLYWIMFSRGFLQYNWSNDKRADERWESRIKGILEACEPVAQKLAQTDVRKGEADFGNVFFRMQGAFVADNLDSDSVALQINEEVHAWEPGHLQKARNRSSAVWNYKSVDISNAGKVGDQLDKAHKEGTMQVWEVVCPGCRSKHVMRTRWEDSRPDLGGLRYDSEKAKVGHEYDYNKLRPTIRYQMPCGFVVHNEDKTTRRQLSLSGGYSEPQNPRAELAHRSYTYESVCVDFIDWMTIIKQKHSALRARRLGDPEPWRLYKSERECIPFDPNDVPLQGLVVLNSEIKKSRDGLPLPRVRLFALDRQQGEKAKGEFPYWWLLIRDVKLEADQTLHSLLVYEGKLETDEQAVGVLRDHKCNMWQGVADSGDDTDHVYQFCLKYGINAIKGGNEIWYTHENGGRRIFSQERPLHLMISGRQPLFPYVPTAIGMIPHPCEPLFWLYSKIGIRERLNFLRAETRYETPSDVSDDYKSHNEAEERITRPHPRTGEQIVEYIQQKTRNDQYVNECYIAMQIEQAGMVKERTIPEGSTTTQQEEAK